MFSGSRFFRVHVFQITGFSGSRFFRVQVFQGPGFSGSRFFKVQVFQGTDFSGSRLFKVQVFQGPGFSGSRFFRFRVQGPGPGFRSSLTPENLLNFERDFFLKMTFCNVLITSFTQIIYISAMKKHFLFYGIMNFRIAEDFFEVVSSLPVSFLKTFSVCSTL